MNPSDNFGPNEPALPNVPSLPPTETGAGGMPAAGVQQPLAPGAAPATAPPAAAAWLPPTVPVQAGTNAGRQGLSDGSAAVPTPAIADDGDIIEKEWVEKAKQIVAQNRQDPYKQARELHRFKAEYLRKRYNKAIEAVED